MAPIKGARPQRIAALIVPRNALGLLLASTDGFRYEIFQFFPSVQPDHFSTLMPGQWTPKVREADQGGSEEGNQRRTSASTPGIPSRSFGQV